MSVNHIFSQEDLRLDCKEEVQKIIKNIQNILTKKLKRKGLIVALSGGIDSSVTAALCVKALGEKRVFGLLLPEKESSEETPHLSKLIADFLDIETSYENITPVLEALQCYERRNDSIRKVIPEFTDKCKCKIVLPSITEGHNLRLFSVIAEMPDGRVLKERLTMEAYLGIVAASNFKQRTRKMLEYYYADKLNYAVAGTPNRLEYDQGFFVKLGDGAADIKPIAHLYKTQVYQLAEYLDIPEEIRSRPPSTDTYSMAQSQEEFYFSLPYDKMDLCLYGKNNNIPIDEVAKATCLETEHIESVFHDIDQKRRTSKYQHLSPQLIEKIAEI